MLCAPLTYGEALETNDKLSIAILSGIAGNFSENQSPAQDVNKSGRPDVSEEIFHLISNSQRELAERIQTILTYLLLAVSLPLTICNVVVFLQKNMRSATGTYVISLSSAQVFYLLIGSVFFVLEAVVEDRFNNFWYWAFYLYFPAYLGVVARRGSYLVMCLVSADRLNAVARPLHVQTFWLSKYPVRSMAVAFLVTALWHSYLLTRTKIVKLWDEKREIHVYKPIRTDLYLRNKELNDGFSLGAKIVLSYITLAMQIVLNVLTIWALRRHSMATKHVQTSANENKQRQKERALTVTILASTICYVTLSLPYAVHYLVYSLSPEYLGRYSNLYQVMTSLTYNLTLFGCGIDFVCFLTLSTSYRKTFLEVFSRFREWTKIKRETEQETWADNVSRDS
ncbi:hypothetical protein BaRGS_00016001 [Batillaria attramentaria]|uniref:G-protein coupled receptors family 1 profile domain-containing protein n=1 Tax=Batillaria attramentaria TaxID=370345 RepID=A0ABD0L0C7_9CAEN